MLPLILKREQHYFCEIIPFLVTHYLKGLLTRKVMELENLFMTYLAKMVAFQSLFAV